MHQRVFHYRDGACGGAEAIGCGFELRGGVAQAVEPAVLRVGEEDVACGRVDGEVVDGVEVVSEVVVQEGCAGVCGWVEGADSRALFRIADAEVVARGAPVDEAVVGGAAVGGVDGGVGEVF